MNDTKIWKAPIGARYLSDFMTEIPENCLFNKRITGCGATELAIRNSIDTIIAMPYVSLVKNKSIYRRDSTYVLGVYQGITEDDIKRYALTEQKLKIATTYDSIPKVIKVLEDIGRNPFKDAFLLVDEWHCLFNDYLYRRDCIRRLLSFATRFDRTTYMSATPIAREFLFDEIKHLPINEVEWPNPTPISVRSEQTNNPIEYIVEYCRSIWTSRFNMHIFINSVTSIRDIIVKARLSPDQVKVVCAITPDNQNILGQEFRIQEPSAPFKRINFYTSTCFEGCDIYDEDGLTFIVSDGRKAKTLIDISTKFTQICGRIRDSKYSGEVIHIFSTTRYSQYISLKEFKMATEKSLQEATEFANDINCLPIKSREKLLNNALILEDEYTIIEDKKLIVDKNRANLDIYNFKICRHIYSKYDNISSEMNILGYNITSHRYTSITQRSKVPNTRISFKELFDEYTKLKQNKPIFSFENYNESCDIIARKCPLVKEAYDKLGVEKVVGLKYQVGNIRREITKLLPTAEVMRIVKLIDDEVKIHTPIPVKEVKLKLQKIYDILEIPHIAKASDLGKWYEVKCSSPRIDGKVTACMTIVRKKILANQ